MSELTAPAGPPQIDTDPSAAGGLSASGLEKAFGPVAVLRGLDLAVGRGEVLAIFGPNGSGKSTLLRILATLSRADRGEAQINGFDTVRQGERVRQTTGVVLHSPMLYGDLTVRENLHFFARMFRLERPTEQISAAADRLHIGQVLDERVQSLSHGMQKRVAIARALLHEPRVLLLDEPESGLDQEARELLEGLLSDWRQAGRCAVMTTHNLGHGLAVCSRVAILSRGRLAFEQSRDEVTEEGLRDAYHRLTGDG